MKYQFLDQKEKLLVSQLVKKELKHYILGLYECDKIIGFIALKSMSEIEYIYILDEYQHKGLATQLIKQAVNIMNHEIFVYDLSIKELFIKNGFIEYDDYLMYHHSITKRFHSYEQLSLFISQQNNRVYSLDNYKNMLDEVMNPQYLLQTIHIGGTNGKGSTTNYINTVLVECGYKCGMFTSPALHSRLEIMRINNQIISEEEILIYANRYIDLWLKYSISMYEIEVFIALMYFLHNEVNFALFEVGLGGEFDATNVIYPLASIITNIGMDHKEYLGDTYKQIAQTKAGIIKENIPLFTTEDKLECLSVFKKVTLDKKSKMNIIQGCKNIQLMNHQIHYDYNDHHFILETEALYQVKNSVLAYEVIQYLNNTGYIDIDHRDILNAIKHAKWNARFETISHNPHIIIDGAHNKEGIDAFVQSAKQYPLKKIIFSALKDKDTDYMIEQLLSICDDITICEFDFYRAASAKELAKNYPVKIEIDFKKAIDHLKDYNGTIFITGSLYFIGQVRDYIINNS